MIYVPTQAEEAVRDLIRAREDALVDKLRARHRLMKFLLRQGRVYRETKSWGVAHREWINAQTFELPASQMTLETYRQTLSEMESRLEGLHKRIETLAEAEPYKTPVRYLRCLKGVDTLSAMTLVAEIQDFERFKRPTGFMAFTRAGQYDFRRLSKGNFDEVLPELEARVNVPTPGFAVFPISTSINT